MAENKINNTEFFPPEEGGAFFNNVTGGAESASGGSGGSGMECLQLRPTPPGPFQYLITEQAKSFVALQELQNEVGALLEFRDLVIETFPNLRSKMAPSMPAAARRDWEPGVRVRRKLASTGDSARSKPQPSVQDSGFSTETSCGKDVHSSASASTSRARPLEDELWALLDVIQRKGVKLRDEAESLRGELDDRQAEETAEESFARALSAAECNCTESRRLREERESLLCRAAALEAAALGARLGVVSAGAGAGVGAGGSPARTPLGRLDRVLETPSRPPRVPTPDSKKFAAILLESNPVELQRQLLTATVYTQVLSEKLKKAAAQRTSILDTLDRTRDINEDLKFQLEEKTIELEGARAKVRQLENRLRSPSQESRQPASRVDRVERGERGERSRDSMRELEPVALGDEARISETPRRSGGRPSRIPLHTAHSSRRASRSPPAPAPGPAPAAPSRPGSAASARSHDKKSSAVPVRRHAPDTKKYERHGIDELLEAESYHDSLNFVTSKSVSQASEMIAEYLSRTERLASRLPPPPPPPRVRPTPNNLALELYHSILYEEANSIDVKALKSINSHGDSKHYDDSLWNGKPQKYFDSMRYSEDDDAGLDGDSLAT